MKECALAEMPAASISAGVAPGLPYAILAPMEVAKRVGS